EIVGYCRISWAGPESFPLDRPRRLARYVVHHAVDALHLVDDAGGDRADKPHVEGIEVRRHAVGRGHRAQAHNVVIGAKVAHHTDRAHGKKHREGLPDLVVEAGAADLLDVDRIRKAQDIELLARDLAGTADREPRSRKRVTADEFFRQA